jgi:hypothetical protein
MHLAGWRTDLRKHVGKQYALKCDRGSMVGSFHGLLRECGKIVCRKRGAGSGDALDKERSVPQYAGRTANGHDHIAELDFLAGSGFNRPDNLSESRNYNVQFVLLQRFGRK